MKSTAIYAADSAAKILLDNFGKISKADIVRNGRYDFTTKIDLEAERAIIKILKKKTPTYNIITEEAGAQRHRSPFTWVIDPLDGTTNYSIGNPFFDISIALVKEQTPILGLVYAPVIDWLFIAEKGGGTTLNGKKITVSDTKELKNSLVCYCRGNDQKNIKRTSEIFSKMSLKAKDFSRMKAGAYELALVAGGQIEAFLYSGVKSWDVAAGALLVSEAGGKVTDFAGKKWDLESKDILATNSKIHSKILKEIKGV